MELLPATPIRMTDSQARRRGTYGRVGQEFGAAGICWETSDKLLSSLSLGLLIEEQRSGQRVKYEAIRDIFHSVSRHLEQPSVVKYP